MNELENLLILNGIPGLGNARIGKLLERFGSAQNVLSLPAKELIFDGEIPSKVAENIVHFSKDEYLKEELGLVKKYGVELISISDENYPDLLKAIPDAPVLLYVKGNLTKENNLSVAIIGSRRASLYGMSIAEKFATSLAELGVTIVSGLARGIDTAAHRGALKAKGATIAVLGSGLATIYPPENKKLFEEISEKGAVISEFAMATPPATYNFPRRNRIISGLSLGVIVAEASAKSGALITSRFALEQGREVFAVPGQVDSPNSQGVHNLIKDGAKLINNVNDVLEELTPQLKFHLKESTKEKNQSVAKSQITKNLSNEEAIVFERINENAMHIDEIADKSNCSVAQVSGVLLKLELKHLVKQLPGKLFVRRSVMNA